MAPPLPIGVFDSGVGGVSVLGEIRRALPREDLIYVADSAFAPYGERDPAFVTDRARTIIRGLAARGAKAVVVACNTATGIAVDTLRREWPALPIVAIEPALKPAAAATSTGVIAVLATTGTLASEKFKRLVDAHGRGVRILARAGTGLVDCVERGQLTADQTRALVEGHVAPLVAAGADTIVLGCTHYPFLLPLIQAAAGPGVRVIDPAVAVARELARRLESLGRLETATRAGRLDFFTTGSPAAVQPVVDQLWTEHVEVLRMDAGD